MPTPHPTLAPSPYYATEAARRAAFPVVKDRIFVAHAGVTILPAAAAKAMEGHLAASCHHHQEFGDVLRDITRARLQGARWIEKNASEVALLGPTSLGLSLFAQGIPWESGDEILLYGDDYPANVYPWLEQERRGARVRWLRPEIPGRLTPEMVAEALTPRTRLVALASCHFLTGWRLDVASVARLLRQRGILFSLDAIQTLGAFPVPAAEVDFLSADAHKWMLGPMAIGFVAVDRQHFSLCRPTLLGAWNVKSPDFIAQESIEFVETAQRYEPGVLNATGIYGMMAALDLLEAVGPERVSALILAARDHLETGLENLGWEFLSPMRHEPWRSGILTARPPKTCGSASLAYNKLEKAGIVASLRKDRQGGEWVRFSPHFYNTAEEMERIVETLAKG